jgi:hypothetical protein
MRESRIDELDPMLVGEIIGFLREWLPSSAISTYRTLMLEAPDRWSQHPHFGGGLVVRHMLRGNGLPEELVRTELLDAIWPELLWRAVLGAEAGNP